MNRDQEGADVGAARFERAFRQVLNFMVQVRQPIPEFGVFAVSPVLPGRGHDGDNYPASVEQIKHVPDMLDVLADIRSLERPAF